MSKTTSGWLAAWGRGAVTLAACALAALAAEAKVIHVSPKALDGVPAAEQTRTIAEAAAAVAAGDRVVIHGGIYREAVVVKSSGSAEAPITFEAAPGERVVVTGADLITDWRREQGPGNLFSTPWPHRFVGWNPTHAHPGDERHRLIGRCEQVFAEHYPLRQVLERSQLARGTFFADLEGKRLYAWTADDADLGKGRTRVEASVRPTAWRIDGSHVRVRGLRFRYAASRAQHGMVHVAGDHATLEDCTFEYANSAGISVAGARGVKLLRCVMQHNGQLGLGAGGAHDLLMSECIVRGNSTKGWDRGWEAGGVKICGGRGAVIERSRFLENRGVGVWLDIGNEATTVRNCLIADNEEAGLFYEISYGLHAHDNVILGNGFDAGGGAWGASAGIAISSSPGCRVERNLLVGNKEGLAYREQLRTTPRIDAAGKLAGQEAVWNHDQVVRYNVIALNRDAQCWGWFDVKDARHWPTAMRAAALGKAAGAAGAARPQQDMAAGYGAKDDQGQPAGLNLAALKLDHADNVYFAAPGQGLFNWGATWHFHKRYAALDGVRTELSLEAGSELADPGFADLLRRDLRVPPGSAALRKHAYPRGEVPGVTLGTLDGKP